MDVSLGGRTVDGLPEPAATNGSCLPMFKITTEDYYSLVDKWVNVSEDAEKAHTAFTSKFCFTRVIVGL